MDFRLLGPFAVIDDGRDIAPRRAQQRAVLALLLLHRNHVVPADALIDALWGDDPPGSAQTALQGHISALRNALGQRRIETRAPGYLLRADATEVDAERFEGVLSEARATRDPTIRARLINDALTLWRGAPLAEFRDEPFAQATIASLDELGAAAIEERMQVELDLGRHAALIAELERLVRSHPLRERLRGQLMLALYRSGRDADALNVHQAARKASSEAFGLDPGAPLQLLERQILARDPALEISAARPTLPEQARKVVTVIVAEIVPSSTDPEDSTELRPQLARARALMENFGASVEPLFSSSLVGIFGARRAFEDDAERAARAAFALRDAIGESSTRIRIGIESGRALVTLTDERVDVAGAVLTEASRLSAGAPSGAIVVGESVRRAASETIDFASLLDGSWLAVAPRAPIPVRHTEDREVPFVGRSQELALLDRARDRVRGGGSQLVTIVGEPGAGKTRLVHEFRGRASGEDAPAWREGQCLPYGAGIALWPLAGIMKQEAGIAASDEPDAARDKLATARPRRSSRPTPPRACRRGSGRETVSEARFHPHSCGSLERLTFRENNTIKSSGAASFRVGCSSLGGRRGDWSAKRRFGAGADCF